MLETGPTVYSPYPRRLECLTIRRYDYKGSTFSSSFLSEKTRKSNHLHMLLQRQHYFLSYFKFKLFQLFWPWFELTTSRSADRRSPNWANRVAVKNRPTFFVMWRNWCNKVRHILHTCIAPSMEWLFPVIVPTVWVRPPPGAVLRLDSCCHRHNQQDQES